MSEKEDVFEQLKKYKELLDSGIITQDEFNDVKKKLLNLETSNKETSKPEEPKNDNATKKVEKPKLFEIFLDSVMFGSYPKTKIIDYNLVLKLNELVNYSIDGYKDVEYNGERYRGVSGEQINWYKYEKLFWNIVDTKNTKLLLQCSSVIDRQMFGVRLEDIEAFPYEQSRIRKWLNRIFYNTAFNEEEKKLIKDAYLFDKNSITEFPVEKKESKIIKLMDKISLPNIYMFDNKKLSSSILYSITDYAKTDNKLLSFVLRDSVFITRENRYEAYQTYIHTDGSFRNWHFSNKIEKYVSPCLWIDTKNSDSNEELWFPESEKDIKKYQEQEQKRLEEEKKRLEEIKRKEAADKFGDIFSNILKDVKFDFNQLEQNAKKKADLENSIIIPDGTTNISDSVLNNANSKKLRTVANVLIPSTVTKMETIWSFGINQGGLILSEELIISNVYYDGTIAQWVSIVMEYRENNPLCGKQAVNFYIKDDNGTVQFNDKKYTLVNNIDFPEVDKIKNGVSLYSLFGVNFKKTIYEGAEYIGPNDNPYLILFKNLDNPNNLIISDKCQLIYTDASRGCNNVRNLNIPLSVLFIYPNAFRGCMKLLTLDISYNIFCFSYVIIYDSAFYGCISLSKVDLSRVNKIEKNAFYDTNLSTIDIPDNCVFDYYSFSNFDNKIKVKNYEEYLNKNNFNKSTGITLLLTEKQIENINTIIEKRKLKKIYKLKKKEVKNTNIFNEFFKL